MDSGRHLVSIRFWQSQAEWTFWLSNALFYLIMCYMILDELNDMKHAYNHSDIYIREAIVRGRFEVRLVMLQHAAFKKLFPYRPRVLMSQIMHRVTQTSIHRRHHIDNLNKIGSRIPVLHQHFLRFQNTEIKKKKVQPAEITQAVTDIISQIDTLGRRQAELDLLQVSRAEHANQPPPPLSTCQPACAC